MKKFLTLLTIIAIQIVGINIVKAESILTFDSLKETQYSIDYLYDTNDGYLFADDNTIYSYDDNHHQVSQKKFNNITNPKIISFANQYLIAGLDNSTLRVFLVDNYLHTISSKEFIVSDLTSLKLYTYENKVYILDFANGTLNSSKIYEIDEELNITESNFSSYTSNLLKSILKSDYYLIHQSGNNMTYYNASTYNEDNNILVGYKLTEDETQIAHLTILDNSGNEVVSLDNQDFPSFNAVELINNTIVTLTNDSNNAYLYFYDFKGNYLERLTINDSPLVNNIYRLGNQLYLINNNIITIYNYDCHINTEEQVYGTVNVLKTANPNELVKIEALPNSGYKIANIIVKDTKGNIIPLEENTFTMPSDDVNISVEYTATVINPETVDMITIVLLSFVLIGLICYKIYRKFIWLR